MADKEIKRPERFDTKELEFPSTTFVRDIDNRVFQSIVLQCLAKIDGVCVAEGRLIENLLPRNSTESIRGVVAEQDSKNHSVGIKVEVRVRYGVVLPRKADEIQSRVAEEITKLTGLHVSYVHVVFKGLMGDETAKGSSPDTVARAGVAMASASEEYSDEF